MGKIWIQNIFCLLLDQNIFFLHQIGDQNNFFFEKKEPPPPVKLNGRSLI